MEFRRGSGGRNPRDVREHDLWRTAHLGRIEPPEFGRATTVVNVIDVRQSYLQKVVREGLRVLGYADEAERSIHFSYEMVALTPSRARAGGTIRRGVPFSAEDEKKPFVEMSGRKGLGVKIDDLIELLSSAPGGDRVPPGSFDEGAEDDARAIAVGALRYFLLKFDGTSSSPSTSTRRSTSRGTPVPTSSTRSSARTTSSASSNAASPPKAVPPAEGWDDDLWPLVLDAATIPEVAQRLDSLELSTIARHAFGLAQAFNHFYHRQPIVNESDPEVRARRLAVAKIFRRAMSRLLGLLGIPEPGRM